MMLFSAVSISEDRIQSGNDCLPGGIVTLVGERDYREPNIKDSSVPFELVATPTIDLSIPIPPPSAEELGFELEFELPAYVNDRFRNSLVIEELIVFHK